MSEPHTLLAKITIKPAQLEAFFCAKTEQPILDENWHAWWNALTMYGKSELTQSKLRFYNDISNQAVIKEFESDPALLGFSDYDATTEVWHFGVFMFSENYLEMLPMIAWLKSAAKFKSVETSDFAIIYDYFWGNEGISALIEYEEQQGSLKPGIESRLDIRPDLLAYADNYLTAKFEELKQNGLMGELD